MIPWHHIFSLYVLAIMIKQNKDLKGIVINDKEHKISQFADDTPLTLDGSSESLFSALETIEFFFKFLRS